MQRGAKSESTQMSRVAAVLATASLPSSFNIRLSLPDSGKHHNESLKLSKGGWIWGHSAHHRAAVVRAGPYHGWGPARLDSYSSIRAFPVSTRGPACQACVFGSCDPCHCLLSRQPFHFWMGLKCKNPNPAGSEVAESE